VWLGDIGRPFGPWVKPFRKAGTCARVAAPASTRWLGLFAGAGHTLALPLDREWLQELGEPRRRPPVENAFDDVRSEQRKAQDAGHVRPADPFGVSHLGQRPVLAALQQPLPPVRTRQGLD
jgi:hypothetical protein